MSTSNVVTLKGSLLAGPPKSSCGSFPSALVNAAFELRPPNKAANVLDHNVRKVDSAGAFVDLLAVGTGKTVTQGTFLYLRTGGPMRIRTTTFTDSGDVVSIQEVDGLFILEFPTAKYLKLLEAQGSGTIEYFVSGTQ